MNSAPNTSVNVKPVGTRSNTKAPAELRALLDMRRDHEALVPAFDPMKKIGASKSPRTRSASIPWSCGGENSMVMPANATSSSAASSTTAVVPEPIQPTITILS